MGTNISIEQLTAPIEPSITAQQQQQLSFSSAATQQSTLPSPNDDKSLHFYKHQISTTSSSSTSSIANESSTQLLTKLKRHHSQFKNHFRKSLFNFDQQTITKNKQKQLQNHSQQNDHHQQQEKQYFDSLNYTNEQLFQLLLDYEYLTYLRQLEIDADHIRLNQKQLQSTLTQINDQICRNKSLIVKFKFISSGTTNSNTCNFDNNRSELEIDAHLLCENSIYFRNLLNKNTIFNEKSSQIDLLIDENLIKYENMLFIRNYLSTNRLNLSKLTTLTTKIQQFLFDIYFQTCFLEIYSLKYKIDDYLTQTVHEFGDLIDILNWSCTYKYANYVYRCLFKQLQLRLNDSCFDSLLKQLILLDKKCLLDLLKSNYTQLCESNLLKLVIHWSKERCLQETKTTTTTNNDTIFKNFQQIRNKSHNGNLSSTKLNLKLLHANAKEKVKRKFNFSSSSIVYIKDEILIENAKFKQIMSEFIQYINFSQLKLDDDCKLNEKFACELTLSDIIYMFNIQQTSQNMPDLYTTTTTLSKQDKPLRLNYLYYEYLRKFCASMLNDISTSTIRSNDSLLPDTLYMVDSLPTHRHHYHQHDDDLQNSIDDDYSSPQQIFQFTNTELIEYESMYARYKELRSSSKHVYKHVKCVYSQVNNYIKLRLFREFNYELDLDHDECSSYLFNYLSHKFDYYCKYKCNCTHKLSKLKYVDEDFS